MPNPALPLVYQLISKKLRLVATRCGTNTASYHVAKAIFRINIFLYARLSVVLVFDESRLSKSATPENAFPLYKLPAKISLIDG